MTTHIAEIVSIFRSLFERDDPRFVVSGAVPFYFAEFGSGTGRAPWDVKMNSLEFITRRAMTAVTLIPVAGTTIKIRKLREVADALCIDVDDIEIWADPPIELTKSVTASVQCRRIYVLLPLASEDGAQQVTYTRQIV